MTFTLREKTSGELVDTIEADNRDVAIAIVVAAFTINWKAFFYLDKGV